VNRLYNVISSYEVIGFFLVFRRINEGNSIKNIYGTSLVRGNKRLYLTSDPVNCPEPIGESAAWSRSEATKKFEIWALHQERSSIN